LGHVIGSAFATLAAIPETRTHSTMRIGADMVNLLFEPKEPAFMTSSAATAGPTHSHEATVADRDDKTQIRSERNGTDWTDVVSLLGEQPKQTG
jgi:hypothetical protein